MNERATYVLPIKSSSLQGLAELTAYLRSLRDVVDIIIVDGSAAAFFDEHRRLWSGFALHIPPNPQVRGANGKARGVVTALAHAGEKIVIADDDVRYDPQGLYQVIDALDRADVVRPQNYFSPYTWHTVVDTSRTLINRVVDGDWPGTLGVRRSALPRGYDRDVLFENLELVRTVRANGGRERCAYGIYVARRPPEASRFWEQRIRQAYDEFARPARLLAALAVLPLTVLGRKRPGALAAAAGALIFAAEIGRRRNGGAHYFPLIASFTAPLWVLERGVCAWLAVGSRLRYGGIRYAGTIVRRAATPLSELRGRAA
ncbi:MAG: glycosyltransferase family 2 protein [Candidatus Eremiobacteraeota bacterium]|nr:glycosyltransferase family 2 protein [Candidatus Eremiobacteraeota bacterium]